MASQPMTNTPDPLFEPGQAGDTHAVGDTDAVVEAWVCAVESGLPAIEDRSSKEALEKLIQWMVRYTPRIVRKVAAHFHLPKRVVDDMVNPTELRHILRMFLTCPASGHRAACPAVTAYVRYAEAARADGTEPRS